MTISALNFAEASAASLRPVGLFRLDFAAGALFITNLDRPVTVGGQTYTPTVLVLAISDIEDNTDAKARRISITLSGFDATARARLFSANFAFTKFTTSICFLNAAGVPVDNAVVLSVSQLSNASGSFDELTGRIELSAETQAVLLNRNSSMLITGASQRLRYAGDTAMDAAPQVAQKRINWGGKDERPPSSAVGGGAGSGGRGSAATGADRVK